MKKIRYVRVFITVIIAVGLVSSVLGINTLLSEEEPEELITGEIPKIDKNVTEEYNTATFVTKCFWGAEALFGPVDGVIRTRVGHSVVRGVNPDDFPKRELIQVDYDPEKISYQQLVDILEAERNPGLLDPRAEFVQAIDYHQKYYLQQNETLFEAYKQIYPNMDDFINSTAVTRANGYVGGHGNLTSLDDLNGLGLGLKGKKILYKAWADQNNVSCNF